MLLINNKITEFVFKREVIIKKFVYTSDDKLFISKYINSIRGI